MPSADRSHGLLKALLFTLLCGLLGSKAPLWIAYPALLVLPFLEVCYMAFHHWDFSVHRLILTCLGLLVVGQTAFYGAILNVIPEHRELR